jgi:hypothetical protein
LFYQRLPPTLAQDQPAFALTITIRIVTPPGKFFRTAATASVYQPSLLPVKVAVRTNDLHRRIYGKADF